MRFKLFGHKETINNLMDYKLLNETDQFVLDGARVHEIRGLDQFSVVFDDIKKKYDMNEGVCGYIVCALGSLLPQIIKPPFLPESINKAIEALLDKDFFLPMIERRILEIRKSREVYIEGNKNEFKDPAKAQEHLLGYVSNFDICDNVANNSAVEKDGLFVLVQNDWRFSEDDPPIEELLMIEAFLPERLLLTVPEFLSSFKSTLDLQKKPATFIADLMGHYLCFSVLRLELSEGKSQPTILLFDSTSEKLLDYTDFIKTLAKLCF